MELKHQVTSLEIAKQLKSLGAKQDSLYHYVNTYSGGEPHLLTTYSPFREADSFYSAFTVAELGELLPDMLDHEGKIKLLSFLKKDTVENRRFVWQWGYYYVHFGEDVKATDQVPQFVAYEENEADARGKLLIYLLENGLQDK